MVDLTMHNSVSQSFGNHELHIFKWNVEFLTNVFQ
jgi:hypothetical protein